MRRRNEQRDFTQRHNRYSVSALSERFQNINWHKYLDALSADKFPASYFDDMELIVAEPEYVDYFQLTIGQVIHFI